MFYQFLVLPIDFICKSVIDCGKLDAVLLLTAMVRLLSFSFHRPCSFCIRSRVAMMSCSSRIL